MATDLKPPKRQTASSSFEFELATSVDDNELNDVLARTPMPGKVSLCFQRQPSYLAAAVVEGRFRQTIVARDCRKEGRIVAIGARSISPLFVNGEVKSIGYLSSLRVLPEYRGGTLLARGYRFLHQLHADGRTQLYVTTISDGNQPALSALTAGRAGLPNYHCAGRYHTLLLPRGRRSQRDHDVISIRAAQRAELPVLIDFWNSAGPQRQFFPALREEDFGTTSSLYRNLEPQHILVAWKANRICGSLALWNQQSFRQTVLSALPPGSALARPIYNTLAYIRRRPPLPVIGQRVPYITAALPVVANDDALVFRALLRAATDNSRFSNERFLALGLHERDPLLSIANAWHTARYITNVYLACWEDGQSLRQSLDERPLYLELGRL